MATDGDIPHRIDDLEKIIFHFPFIDRIPHRIDDLEIKDRMLSAMIDIPHRIDDLENCLK